MVLSELSVPAAADIPPVLSIIDGCSYIFNMDSICKICADTLSLHIMTQIEPMHIAIIAAALLVLTAAAALIVHYSRPLPRRMASRIRRRRYIRMEQFLETWQQDKKDFPGCYIILIYNKKLILNPMHYDDIYIGQSVHVRQRVFHHLKGHGNGEVYYGLRSGCKVYILIEKCRPKKLNQYEKELIAYFDATSSINMTTGGSARR